MKVEPQVNSCPFELTALEWSPPQAVKITFSRIKTGTFENLRSGSPIPSYPLSFEPIEKS